VRSNGADLLPKRPIVNFLGGSVVDDPANNQILVTLGGVTISVANLIDNFTQPGVGANVVAHVSLSTGFSPGLVLYVQGGGFYVVQSLPDSTHVTLTNSGSFANAAPGATVTNGVLVIPSGPPPMLVQSNDAAITQRSILDIVGAQYTDTGTAMRFVVSSFGAPVIVSGSHTMQPGETWAEVHPDDQVAMPTVPVVGVTLEFVGRGNTFSAGHPVVFTGSGFNLDDPNDPNNIDGLHPSASPVKGTTENTTWRYRFNGTLWRFVA
jgi:hypothetical protein